MRSEMTLRPLLVNFCTGKAEFRFMKLGLIEKPDMRKKLVSCAVDLKAVLLI